MQLREGYNMDRKKEYKAPTVRTEVIKVGVFGSYGSSDEGSEDSTWSPVNFLAPLFGWCCS